MEGRYRLFLTVFAVAALLLLVLAVACGGDAGQEDSAPSGDSTTRAEATPQGTGESQSQESGPGASSAGANTPRPTEQAAQQQRSSGATTPDASTPQPTEETTPQQRSDGTGAATPQPSPVTPASTAKGETCPAPPASLLPPGQTSAETDREALVAIFDATNGESWDDSGLWASRRPISEWPGVTTNDDGRVVALKLYGVSGEIPAELGNLSSLTRLEISRSQLSGGIPAELGDLSNLIILGISISGLTGEIPPELCNLTRLSFLNLSVNKLSGELPGRFGWAQALT